MSQKDGWEAKLDPYGRLYLDEGLPAAGMDVTIRLDAADPAAAGHVAEAGLQLHAQVGEIIVGHVASSAQLRNIAQLPCVQEVQMSRPLFEGGSGPITGESHNERGKA